MMQGVLYDTQDYFHTLGWLGKPVGGSCAPCVLRRLPWGDMDARGSWPYQSFPTVAQVDELASGEWTANPKPQIPLTWTGVIRPDCQGDEIQQQVSILESRYHIHWQPLKPHLCHLPQVSPVRHTYSTRTRKRLRLAENVFFVDVRYSIADIYEILGKWQEQLKDIRAIPYCSSPDPAHFDGLHLLARRMPECLCSIELRRRHDRSLQAVLILTRASDQRKSWHAHSFLSREDARRHFGTYLLFAAAIDHLGCDPIWWGGQPTGPNGPGVFHFKQRFSNASAPSHLVSIDLHPDRLMVVRATHPHYAWLPDYRNPQEELQ